jgi:hypothetical protein
MFVRGMIGRGIFFDSTAFLECFACHGLSLEPCRTFGLRRQAKRDAAFARGLANTKALSPLRSASAAQNGARVRCACPRPPRSQIEFCPRLPCR